MRTMRAVAALAVGLGLALSVAGGAGAEYGNHRERALAKLETRIAISVLSLQTEIAEIEAVADRMRPEGAGT